MPPINPYAYQYPPIAPTFQPYQQPLVQAQQQNNAIILQCLKTSKW